MQVAGEDPPPPFWGGGGGLSIHNFAPLPPHSIIMDTQVAMIDAIINVVKYSIT